MPNASNITRAAVPVNIETDSDALHASAAETDASFKATVPLLNAVRCTSLYCDVIALL